MFVIVRKRETLKDMFSRNTCDDEFWAGFSWGAFPRTFFSEEEAKREINLLDLRGENLEVISW